MLPKLDLKPARYQPRKQEIVSRYLLTADSSGAFSATRVCHTKTPPHPPPPTLICSLSGNICSFQCRFNISAALAALSGSRAGLFSGCEASDSCRFRLVQVAPISLVMRRDDKDRARRESPRLGFGGQTEKRSGEEKRARLFQHD